MRKIVFLISFFIISLCVNFRNVSALTMSFDDNYFAYGSQFGNGTAYNWSKNWYTGGTTQYFQLAFTITDYNNNFKGTSLMVQHEVCIPYAPTSISFDDTSAHNEYGSTVSGIRIEDIGICPTMGGINSRKYKITYYVSTPKDVPTSNLFFGVVFKVTTAQSMYFRGNENFETTTKLVDPNDNSYLIEETNEKLDEINDYLTDDTPPDSDISGLGNVSGLLPPGPLDSLLNIPFQFLSILTSSMSGTCVPLTGDFVWGSKITLPCFDEIIYGKINSTLMNFISLIPASFILINYFKHLYKKVERAVSLESTSDDEWGCI